MIFQTIGTAIAGTRIQVVTHYADTLTISPGSATITTAAGTQGFTGNAADSVGTALTIGWLSKSTSVLTVNPSSGISTTATAAGNGSTYVVITGGTRRDSALVTVSGQPTLPSTVDVTVGNDFFKSVHNTTQDPAIDTLAVGGTVTWTWTPGGINHTVTSTGSPTFISSGSQSSGTFSRTFNATGDYSYQCSIHPSMTGVVRVR